MAAKANSLKAPPRNHAITLPMHVIIIHIRRSAQTRSATHLRFVLITQLPQLPSAQPLVLAVAHVAPLLAVYEVFLT